MALESRCARRCFSGANERAMKIILVRHGESAGNVRHEINDDPQRIVNLTARGRAQAEAAAEKLCTIAFTHAYASEFPRAQQTAEILLRHHALELHIVSSMTVYLDSAAPQACGTKATVVRKAAG